MKWCLVFYLLLGHIQIFQSLYDGYMASMHTLGQIVCMQFWAGNSFPRHAWTWTLHIITQNDLQEMKFILFEQSMWSHQYMQAPVEK